MGADQPPVAAAATGPPDAGLPTAVRAWAEEVLGTAIAEAGLISGGNRHGTWDLSVTEPGVDGLTQAVLRVGGGEDGPSRGPSPLQREAAAYAAVAKVVDSAGIPAGSTTQGQAVSGTKDSEPLVPVPKLLGGGSVGTADVLLVSRLPGTATLPQSGPARQSVLVDLMRCIAALHALDVGALDLGALGTEGPGPQANRTAWARHELQAWEGRYRATDRLDPLIECALAWCRARVPEDDRPAVLVHGDVGPGNFLHDGARVTGLVDWELAHLGDPLDDLAGFSLRTVHAQLDGFAELAVAYGRAAGEPVDPSRLAWHQVLAALRVVIIRHVDPAVQPDARQANRMISAVLHRRLLVEALHLASGIDLPPPIDVPAEGSPRTALFDAAAELLRHEVLPHTAPAGAAAVKAVARIVKHLAEVDRMGSLADTAIAAAFADVRDPAGAAGGRLERLGSRRSSSLDEEGPDRADAGRPNRRPGPAAHAPSTDRADAGRPNQRPGPAAHAPSTDRADAGRPNQRPGPAAHAPSTDRADAGRRDLAERLRDGDLDPLDALPALTVDAAWDTALLRPAMGALADRPLPTASPIGSSA